MGNVGSRVMGIWGVGGCNLGVGDLWVGHLGGGGRGSGR